MNTKIVTRVLVVLIVLALVVTACAPATGTSASADVDKIVLEGKKTEVVLWHNRSQSDQDLLQKMLDEFNASNPYGITARAEIAGASYNDVYNKISAAIQAGSPPNIAVAYQNQAAFYRSQNAVIDLGPYISSSKYGLTDADKKDYFQAFLNSDKNPQFAGETLGFPTQRSLEVMYYNVDWLAKLGYTEAPKDWKTWEEVACKAAQESGKAGWAFIHEASNFASQVFSRGGRILAEDGQSYVFNSQAGQDTLAMIQRMAANKCLVEIPVSERYGEQNRFANGDVLFVFASSSGMNYYADAVAKGANFKWDIAPLPQTGELHMNLYGASMSVFKTTPEAQLASWLVIKFLGEPAQTSRWAEKTGYLPVRASVKDEVINAFKADPKWSAAAASYAKLFDWANAGMVESPVAGYDAVRTLIDTDCMSVVINDPKADVKTTLDNAVTKANGILKENAPTK
ncbi:MAG: extracellular solute-binding protein [Anaerolineae bacterium]